MHAPYGIAPELVMAIPEPVLDSVVASEAAVMADLPTSEYDVSVRVLHVFSHVSHPAAPSPRVGSGPSSREGRSAGPSHRRRSPGPSRHRSSPSGGGRRGCSLGRSRQLPLLPTPVGPTLLAACRPRCRPRHRRRRGKRSLTAQVVPVPVTSPVSRWDPCSPASVGQVLALGLEILDGCTLDSNLLSSPEVSSVASCSSLGPLGLWKLRVTPRLLAFRFLQPGRFPSCVCPFPDQDCVCSPLESSPCPVSASADPTDRSAALEASVRDGLLPSLIDRLLDAGISPEPIYR